MTSLKRRQFCRATSLAAAAGVLAGAGQVRAEVTCNTLSDGEVLCMPRGSLSANEQVLLRSLNDFFNRYPQAAAESPEDRERTIDRALQDYRSIERPSRER